MWSLRNLLFALCTALSAVSRAAGLIHVFGYEGRDVNVSCQYDQGYESYEKYLCKNNCGNDDILITTAQTKRDKYSIYDDKTTRIFTVTISSLHDLDSGKYWCGVTRTGKDIYTEVTLKIRQDSCCDNVVTKQSYDGGSVALSCPYESENQNSLKYVCRGKQPSTCLQQALITSDNTHSGRFTLTDEKVSNKFTVTITSLTQEDSGSYLCGVHRDSGLDVFSAVELEVKEWCCVKSNNMGGIVGHAVTLQCPYPPQHRNNRKFLCKGDQRKNCIDMVTTQSRFTLQDDVSSSLFLVKISELKAGDAGTYWCGSDSQWGAGDYTKIQLSVVFPQPTSTVSTVETVERNSAHSSGKHVKVFPQPTSTVSTVETVETNSTLQSGKHVKDAVLYVVFAGCAALLILTFALVIAYKYKCHKVQGVEVATNRKKPSTIAEAMDGGDIYENQEVVPYSKPRKSQQQSVCLQYDDVDDDQPDYENITEDIYCNQSFHKANKR